MKLFVVNPRSTVGVFIAPGCGSLHPRSSTEAVEHPGGSVLETDSERWR